MFTTLRVHSHRARQRLIDTLGYRPYSYFTWSGPGEFYRVPDDHGRQCRELKGVTHARIDPSELRPCWTTRPLPPHPSYALQQWGALGNDIPPLGSTEGRLAVACWTDRSDIISQPYPQKKEAAMSKCPTCLRPQYSRHGICADCRRSIGQCALCGDNLRGYDAHSTLYGVKICGHCHACNNANVDRENGKMLTRLGRRFDRLYKQFQDGKLWPEIQCRHVASDGTISLAPVGPDFHMDAPGGMPQTQNQEYRHAHC